MKFAVVVFPGSNSDHDAHYAVEHVLEKAARFVWHKDTSLGDTDAVILPGGFRARRLPAHRRHRPLLADHGRRAAVCRGRRSVLGICNGFRSCSKRDCCRRDAAQRPPALPLRS
jgi:phosphoribosylformylglycinamidine synthase